MTNLEAIKRIGARERPPKPPRNGDAEMRAMLSEVDLLGLIRADTGENGRKSGDRYDFKSCPICGHRDCFSFYPDTNSWACFGASNSTGYDGGSALEYLKATRTDDDVAAVRWLREATGRPYAKDGPETAPGERGGLILPPPESVRASEPRPRNSVLIPGVVRRGHIMSIAGKGKVGKSWLSIELTIATALGTAWFQGGFRVEGGGRCLFIDPELDPKSLEQRFHTVCEAMGADAAKVDELVSKWPLRGVPNATMANVAHDVEMLYGYGDLSLIVVDSASAFVEDDENSSVAVRRYYSHLLRIAAHTGATVLVVLHFGKARDGDRSASERARGSSVWLDAPDSFLTLTEVYPPSGKPSDYLDESEYALLLESGGLREFPRMEPVPLIFKYPCHRVDVDGITEGWKPDSSMRDGGKKTAELNRAKSEAAISKAIVNLLAYCYEHRVGEDGLIFKDAVEISGVSDKTLLKALSGCEHFELVEVTRRKRYVRPVNPPREPPAALAL